MISESKSLFTYCFGERKGNLGSKVEDYETEKIVLDLVSAVGFLRWDVCLHLSFSTSLK